LSIVNGTLGCRGTPVGKHCFKETESEIWERSELESDILLYLHYATLPGKLGYSLQSALSRHFFSVAVRIVASKEATVIINLCMNIDIDFRSNKF